MIFECCASAPTPRVPGAWFVWTRGDAKAEGSAIPFDDAMRVITQAHTALNTPATDPKARYTALKSTADSLKDLIVTTFPTWTHRQQSTQTLKDAREEYAYALMCYTKSEMQACIVQQHASSQVSRQALSQAAHNAAHLKMMFARLACSPEAALEAYMHQSQACSLMAQHMESQWDSSGSGIGNAIAWQQHSVEALKQAQSSTAEAMQELNRLKQRNTTFEKVADVGPMHLSLQ